jgi:catechol 2,3-dioxygenase-like lactoylglutathione lyase family enzyme
MMRAHPRLKLGHIELFVSDPGEARDFYRNVLGCQVLDAQSDRFVWLRLGEQDLLLRPDRRSDGGAGKKAPGLALVLYTDDLERAAEALRRHGVVVKPVEGEARCLSFSDPDGHWFQLVDPGDH